MTKIYACLVGNWVCLNDDPNCVIGSDRQSPDLWWKENPDIYSPYQRKAENTMYGLDYVQLTYNGADYRISPIFLQIVTE